ncbi:MAG: hypothetical protein HY720_15240 [Planctomycetes bacterium]|nr:hypothetical protein [Planctomycetota bacterium]
MTERREGPIQLVGRGRSPVSLPRLIVVTGIPLVLCIWLLVAMAKEPSSPVADPRDPNRPLSREESAPDSRSLWPAVLFAGIGLGGILAAGVATDLRYRRLWRNGRKATGRLLARGRREFLYAFEEAGVARVRRGRSARPLPPGVAPGAAVEVLHDGRRSVAVAIDPASSGPELDPQIPRQPRLPAWWIGAALAIVASGTALSLVAGNWLALAGVLVFWAPLLAATLLRRERIA